MNFDGTLSSTNQLTGLRVILIDAKWGTITERTGRRAYCSPLLVEVEAVLLRLRIASVLEIKKLAMEGDFIEVINSLKGNSEECP